MGRCIWRQHLFCTTGIAIVLVSSNSAVCQQPASVGQSKVRAWLDGLNDASPAKRLEMAHALNELGADHKSEVAELVRALEHHNPFVRRCVAAALGEFPIQPEVSVPALIKALEDPDPHVRAHASVALSKTGAPAVPHLIAAIERPEVVVGKERIGRHGQTKPLLSDYALYALSEIGGDAAGVLVEKVRDLARKIDAADPEGMDRDKATRLTMYEYAIAGCGMSAVEHITPCLMDESPRVVVLALNALRAIGPDARTAASEVRKVIDRHPSLAERAILCLSWIGAEPELSNVLQTNADATLRAFTADAMSSIGKAAIPALEKALMSDTDVNVRAAAARAIADLSSGSQESIPVLVRALADDPKVQEAAAYALRVTTDGPSQEARDALPQLVEMLRTGPPAIRPEIASILGSMGRDANAAIPDLIRMTKTHEGRSAIRALGEIDPQSNDVIGALTELLSTDDKSVDLRTVALALRGAGDKGSNAVSALAKQFRSDDYNLSRCAETALIRIGLPGVTTLIEIAKDSNEKLDLRVKAIKALKDVVPENEQVANSIIELLKDENMTIRRQGALVLARVPCEKRSVYDILNEWLESQPQTDMYELYRALSRVGTLGPAALVKRLEDPQTLDRPDIARSIHKEMVIDAPTLAALFRLLGDGDSEVRSAVAGALGRVGKGNSRVTAELLDFIAREADGSTGELIKTGFEAIASLKPSDRTTLLKLATLARHKNDKVRCLTIETFASLVPLDEETRAVLTSALYDDNQAVRFAALGTMNKIGVRLSDVTGGFTDACIDSLVERRTQGALNQIADWFRPSLLVSDDGFSTGLPRFPWPPPQCTHMRAFGDQAGQFDRSLLGDVGSKLGDICQKLLAALYRVDPSYESGLFGAPGGFVLLTRIEQIDELGNPLAGGNRWTERRLPPSSLADYISQLFFEKPGYYRFIAFVVTPEPLFETSTQPLPPISSGAQILPKELAEDTFDGKTCYVLVYSFKRRQGGSSEPFLDLSAFDHVSKAGILAALKMP